MSQGKLPRVTYLRGYTLSLGRVRVSVARVLRLLGFAALQRISLEAVSKQLSQSFKATDSTVSKQLTQQLLRVGRGKGLRYLIGCNYHQLWRIYK